MATDRAAPTGAPVPGDRVDGGGSTVTPGAPHGEVDPAGGPPGRDRGLVYGLAAYGLWGLFPLYWKALDTQGADEVLAHRIVWSLVFCVVVLAVTGRLAGALRPGWHQVRLLAVAAALITVNWYLFIWATSSGHVVDASLGYFVNPLVTVVLGVVVRGESLRRLQWIAVGTATVGVVLLTVLTGRLPWLALVLAGTFATYGLVKSSVRLPALEGLAVETAIVALPAAAWLVVVGSDGALATGPPTTMLLAIGAGPVTAIPLLLFAGAARRLPLSVVGFLQYLAPILQFLVGVVLLGEDFGPGRVVGFVVIWVALMVFVVDQARHRRRVVAVVA